MIIKQFFKLYFKTGLEGQGKLLVLQDQFELTKSLNSLDLGKTNFRQEFIISPQLIAIQSKGQTEAYYYHIRGLKEFLQLQGK